MSDVFNPDVKQCISNQSRGYWLLSDVVFGAISIVGKLGAKYIKKAIVMPPFVCGSANSKLEIYMPEWCIRAYIFRGFFCHLLEVLMLARLTTCWF